MKTTQICPKCDSRQLWVIDRLTQRDGSSTHVAAPKPVIAANLPSDGGFWSASHGEYVVGGTFEVWICVQCGFMEWYARDVNKVLEKLAKEPGLGVRLVDGGPPPRPYR